MRLFLINAIILIIASFVINAVRMSFGVYISNKIGEEALGVFSLISSVYFFFITLAISGINLTVTRIISEELVTKEQYRIKKAMKQCITFSLVLGIIAGVLLFTFAPFIAGNWLHGKVSQVPLYIFSICLPFMSVASAVNGYFSALRKVVKNISQQVLEMLIQIVITVYLLSLFLPSGIEYICIALVLGTAISEVISGIYLYILYKIETRNTKNVVIKDLNYGPRIFRISMPIAITSYIRSGLSTLKQILIPLKLEESGMSCDKALSKYGMMSGMVMPLLMFPSTIVSAFSALLIPEFSEYNYTKSYNTINSTITKIFKITFIFSFFIMGIFYSFSDELGTLIYHSEEVAAALRTLCPLVLFIYIDNIIDSILKGLDKQVSVMVVNIVDLVVSIGFIYFLLPMQGFFGYIIVIFISEILNFSISLGALIKTTNFKFDYSNWIIKPLAGMIFAIFISNIIKVQVHYEVLVLVINIALFLLAYIWILAFSSCIKKEDFKI